MEELYNMLTAELKEEHERWVKSNKTLRSIETARDQIKPEGDISITPALEILNTAYEKELRWNKEATSHMYAFKDIIMRIERYANEHGKKWEKTREIFGY